MSTDCTWFKNTKTTPPKKIKTSKQTKTKCLSIQCHSIPCLFAFLFHSTNKWGAEGGTKNTSLRKSFKNIKVGRRLGREKHGKKMIRFLLNTN